MKHDNTTSQPALEYDDNISKTIPYYNCLHDNVCQWVQALHEQPQTWLEVGCGTGTLVEKILRTFPETTVAAADPSASMLALAQAKLEKVQGVEFVNAGTEELTYPANSFDVISAVLAHHYFDVPTRRQATQNCFRMLKTGGVYITFESILPTTEKSKEYALRYWRNAQLNSGKSEQAVAKHIGRFGLEFFPITIAEHLQLLQDAGFSHVELCWLSAMQAGFYALK